jgi:hypothetical protein
MTRAGSFTAEGVAKKPLEELHDVTAETLQALHRALGVHRRGDGCGLRLGRGGRSHLGHLQSGTVAAMRG